MKYLNRFKKFFNKPKENKYYEFMSVYDATLFSKNHNREKLTNEEISKIKSLIKSGLINFDIFYFIYRQLIY